MITFNHLGEALYNGMKTNMTRETLQDFEINTGTNAILMLEKTIQESIQYKREEKINYLLNPNPNDNTNNNTQK